MKHRTLIATVALAAAILVPAANASHARSHAPSQHVRAFHPDPMGCCGFNPTKPAY